MIFVLAVVLLVFGPKKLPDLGHGLGKGIRWCRRTARLGPYAVSISEGQTGLVQSHVAAWTRRLKLRLSRRFGGSSYEKTSASPRTLIRGASSRGHCATVDNVISAADKRAPVRGEEGYQLRHFLEASWPADGNASKHVHYPLTCSILADAAAF